MKAVLVASGDPDPADVRWLHRADLLVAVDAGAAWLAGLQRRPDALVGDLDSVDAELVRMLEADGVAIERHPSAKDSSDTELALAYARGCGADAIVVVGAFGGPRIDHELANLMLLVDPELSGLRDLRIVRGATVVRAMHGGAQLPLEGAVGDLVTLLPVSGDAVGVQTAGLRYPLHGETLSIGRSRGLSNSVVETPASVSLQGGSLLVIETMEEGGEP